MPLIPLLLDVSTSRSSAVAVPDNIKLTAAAEEVRPIKRIPKRAVGVDDDYDADVRTDTSSRSPSPSGKADNSQSGKRHRQTANESYRDDIYRKNDEATGENYEEGTKKNDRPAFEKPTMHYSEFPPLEVINEENGLPAAPKKRVRINLENVMHTIIPNRDDIKDTAKEYALRKEAMGGISDDVDWSKQSAMPSPRSKSSVEEESSDFISYHASSSSEDVHVSVPPTSQSEDGPMRIVDRGSVETSPPQGTIHPSTTLFSNTATHGFNAGPLTTLIASAPAAPTAPLHFPPPMALFINAPQKPQLSLESLHIKPQPPLYVQFAPPPHTPALYRAPPPPPPPEPRLRPYFVVSAATRDSELHYAPANMTPHEHQQQLQLQAMAQQSLSKAQESVILNVPPAAQAAYSGADQNVRPVVTTAIVASHYTTSALPLPLPMVPIQPPPPVKTESPRDLDHTPHPPLIKSEPVVAPKPAPPVAEPTRKITKPSFYIARFDVPKDRSDLS